MCYTRWNFWLELMCNGAVKQVLAGVSCAHGRFSWNLFEITLSLAIASIDLALMSNNVWFLSNTFFGSSK